MRRTPAAVAGLRLVQRGGQIEIAFQAPLASIDGTRLPMLDVELLVAAGDGDFEKLAARRTRRAQPGESVVERVPVPGAGTTVRVSARALAGSRSSVRTPVTGLVAQDPPPPPRALVADLVAEGVALAWKGSRPTPVDAALPPPAGALAPFTGPPRPRPLPPGAPPQGAVAGAPAAPAPAASPSAQPGPAAPGGTGATSPGEAAGPPPFPGGFSVYRRPADGVYTTPLAPPVEAKALTDTAAPLGQEVCYQVRAVACLDPLVESDASDEACVTVRDIAAPRAPTGLTVLPVAEGLDLTWSPSPESDLAGYRILRSAAGEPAEPLAEVAPSQARYVDATASPGVGYTYRIVAFDEAGNSSPPSNPADAVRP